MLALLQIYHSACMGGGVKEQGERNPVIKKLSKKVTHFHVFSTLPSFVTVLDPRPWDLSLNLISLHQSASPVWI